jgi:hypothetical protein
MHVYYVVLQHVSLIRSVATIFAVHDSSPLRRPLCPPKLLTSRHPVPTTRRLNRHYDDTRCVAAYYDH